MKRALALLAFAAACEGSDSTAGSRSAIVAAPAACVDGDTPLAPVSAGETPLLFDLSLPAGWWVEATGDHRSVGVALGTGDATHHSSRRLSGRQALVRQPHHTLEASPTGTPAFEIALGPHVVGVRNLQGHLYYDIAVPLLHDGEEVAVVWLQLDTAHARPPLACDDDLAAFLDAVVASLTPNPLTTFEDWLWASPGPLDL